MSSVISRLVREFTAPGRQSALCQTGEPRGPQGVVTAATRAHRRLLRRADFVVMRQAKRLYPRAFNAPPIALEAGDARAVKNALKTIRRSRAR